MSRLSKDQEAFLRTTRQQLRDCRTRLASMKTELEREAQDGERWLRRAVEDLSTKRDELENRIQDAAEETEAGWKNVKADLESAVHDMRDAVARTFEAVGR